MEEMSTSLTTWRAFLPALDLIGPSYPPSFVSLLIYPSIVSLLRHLYVLAVEHRGVEAREAGTGQPVYLPIQLTLKDGTTMHNVRTQKTERQGERADIE
jgi:hypothetical protein